MNLELKIAIRYIKSKSKKGFVSLFSGISMAGLALGVMSLITVMSVMNGFHIELRDRILGSISHAYISEYNGNVTNWEELSNKVKQNPNVLSTSPYIEKHGLLVFKGRSEATAVRGVLIEKEKTTSQVIQKITNGKLQLNKSEIIIGKGLSDKLGVEIGDKITLITPQMKVSIMGVSPRAKKFKVSGIFSAGINEYDNGLSFIGMKDSQRLFNMKNEVSGLRIKYKDLFDSKKVTKEIVSELGEDIYYGVDWQKQKANFMRALELEKQMVSIILSLIIAVAAFNIVSMMIMVVTDKRADIAILRTMGLEGRRVVRVFFYQGLIIGMIGIILGIMLGIALSMNLDTIVKLIENLLNIQFFSKDVFYITNFPTSIELNDILKITITSIILVVLSSIYPAKRAGKMEIAKVLNHE